MVFAGSVPAELLEPKRPGQGPPLTVGGDAEVEDESSGDELFVDPPPQGRKRKRDGKAAKPPNRMRLDLIGFQPGGHALVSGATGTGKTSYVKDILLGKGVHKGTKPAWDAVIVLCDEFSLGQPAYHELKKEFKGKGGVRFVKGLPLDIGGRDRGTRFLEALRDNGNRAYKTMVIVDDLMTECETGPGKQFVDKLFTSARHCGADVYQLTQEHTYARRRRLNVRYLVCFKTPACVRSLHHICSEIRPETRGRDVLECYRQAVEQHGGHGCLVICLDQPNQFMFRSTDMRDAFDLDAPPVDEDGTPVLGGALGFD